MASSIVCAHTHTHTHTHTLQCNNITRSSSKVMYYLFCSKVHLYKYEILYGDYVARSTDLAKLVSMNHFL